MPNTREIITLQFGNYSNHLGAHWWNIQESGFHYDSEAASSEINHDVLYREGINLNRQTTFTPRLLLVDLDGSLKHLPVEGELYGNSYKRATADDSDKEAVVKKLKEDLDTDLEVVEEPVAAKHDFQKDLDDPEINIEEKEYNLSENVDTWADFLYARYHPRTVNVVNEFKHSTDTQKFDTYPLGAQLWQTAHFEDEFCDKIRQYVEECDYMQGFQTIFDCYNGFSGLATQCVEYLNDEYGKANFTIPIYTPASVLFEGADEAMTDSIRVVNSIMAFSNLVENCSLIVPLSTQDRVWRQLGSSREIRSLHYKSDNLYQTSAILAAYLDTISIGYRLKDAPNECALAGFCADLTNYGRKIAAAGLSLPFPMQENVDLIDCLDKFEGKLFTQLTPNCSVGTDYVIQSLSVRGIPNSRLKRPREQAQQQMRMAAYKCDSVSEMFQLYLQCSNHASMAHVAAIEMPMPTRIPFPCEMFDKSLGTTGFLSSSFSESSGPSSAHKVNSVPTVATVQSSSELENMLETLHREAARIKIAKMHRFKAAGLDNDTYSQALEYLLEFNDNYNDNFDL